MNKITLGGKEYELEEDKNHFAYKDGVVYKVLETTTSVMAMSCIGRMRFVLDESGDIPAEAYPMINFNNGFDLLSLAQIDRYSKIVEAFNKYDKRTIR